jgi:putative flippase GtrA
LTKFINSEFLRFIITGMINTGTSFVLYLMFKLVMPYSIAYVIAYICGVVVSYFLNSLFVFHQPLHWKKALQFPLVYVGQLILGFLLLIIWVERLHVNSTIAPILVVICTVPVTFVLSRLIIKGRGIHPAKHSA